MPEFVLNKSSNTCNVICCGRWKVRETDSQNSDASMESSFTKRKKRKQNCRYNGSVSKNHPRENTRAHAHAHTHAHTQARTQLREGPETTHSTRRRGLTCIGCLARKTRLLSETFRPHRNFDVLFVCLPPDESELLIFKKMAA